MLHIYPIILNAQLFMYGFKNFHLHSLSIQIEFDRPRA